MERKAQRRTDDFFSYPCSDAVRRKIHSFCFIFLLFLYGRWKKTRRKCRGAPLEEEEKLCKFNCILWRSFRFCLTLWLVAEKRAGNRIKKSIEKKSGVDVLHQPHMEESREGGKGRKANFWKINEKFFFLVLLFCRDHPLNSCWCRHSHKMNL